MIPDEVYILGRSYEIEEAHSNPAQDVVLGVAQYAQGKILLNMDTDLECQLKSLWHEMFHIWQQDIQGRMDEDLANLVSAFVHHTLCHNREIADCYSTEEED